MSSFHHFSPRALLICLLLAAAPAAADVPARISFQGCLKDASGEPVNSTVTMTFSLYAAAGDEGSPASPPLWRESQQVEVAGCVYGVELGRVTPLEDSLFGDNPLYLGIAVGEEAEMTPRQALTSVPFALRAATAETVTTLDAEAIVDGSVTGAKLADGAVTDAKVTGPISGEKLGLHTHDAGDLATGALDDARLSANVLLADGNQTISGVKEFTPTTGSVPFLVGATRQGVVTNLNAEMLGGQKLADLDSRFSRRGILLVNRTGSGAGTVTSAPSGIDCGGACLAAYDAGTPVTLTASPDGTSTFTGWSGACSGTGACTVSMDGVKSVVAGFSRKTYALSVTRLGGTVISDPPGIYCGARCGELYPAGSVVTLTAAADSGSTFVGWSGGTCSGSATTCTVTMDAARNVAATFTIPLTVGRTGTGGGTVSSTPGGVSCPAACSASYNPGTVLTLTAAPDVSSIFTGWSGSCSGTGSCTVTMDAAKAVTATFTRVNNTLAVSKSGSGEGTVTSTPSGLSCGVTCQADYVQNATVTLSATPASGSSFAGWSGACSGTGPCSVTMDVARSVEARFIRNFYTLAVARTGGGTVTSDVGALYCGARCSDSLPADSNVNLTATPDAFATFAGWSGACTHAVPVCELSMNSAKSASARFTLPVTVSVGGAGTVTSNPAGINCASGSGACTASFDGGTIIALSATPDPGKVFSGWSGACGGVEVCMVPVDTAKAVQAIFD